MIDDLIRLRIAVGLLGEKDQSNWWSSKFLSGNGHDFLGHVFGNGTSIAQYNGVMAAAKRRHDDAVGMGERVFHLFRLPEAIEQAFLDELPSIITSVLNEIVDVEASRHFLQTVSARDVEPRQGAVLVGSPNDLSGRTWLRLAAAHYLAAFTSGNTSFPYLAEHKI